MSTYVLPFATGSSFPEGDLTVLTAGIPRYIAFGGGNHVAFSFFVSPVNLSVKEILSGYTLAPNSALTGTESILVSLLRNDAIVSVCTLTASQKCCRSSKLDCCNIIVCKGDLLRIRIELIANSGRSIQTQVFGSLSFEASRSIIAFSSGNLHHLVPGEPRFIVFGGGIQSSGAYFIAPSNANINLCAAVSSSELLSNEFVTFTLQRGSSPETLIDVLSVATRGPSVCAEPIFINRGDFLRLKVEITAAAQRLLLLGAGLGVASTGSWWNWSPGGLNLLQPLGVNQTVTFGGFFHPDTEGFINSKNGVLSGLITHVGPGVLQAGEEIKVNLLVVPFCFDSGCKSGFNGTLCTLTNSQNTCQISTNVAIRKGDFVALQVLLNGQTARRITFAASALFQTKDQLKCPAKCLVKRPVKCKKC